MIRYTLLKKSCDDVQRWAKWIGCEFGISWWNMENVDGERLVNLSRDEFLNLWPSLVGEVPWEHFMYLKKNKVIDVSTTLYRGVVTLVSGQSDIG